jgi:hypothetical protein
VLTPDIAESRLYQAEALFNLIETRMGGVLYVTDDPPQLQAEGPHPFSTDVIYSVEYLKEELRFVVNAYVKLREFRDQKKRDST